MKRIFFIAVCLMIFSCKKDKPADISMGNTYGGGIIFYIDGTGQHGLIAAPADQSAAVQWYNGTYIKTNTFEGGVGKGLPNTAAIDSAQGTGVYAASICHNLVLGGFSDWFLPSRNELNLLYQQRNVVGGFVTGHYWCSPEHDTLSAWNQDFPYGPQYYADKASMGCVRAIRAF